MAEELEPRRPKPLDERLWQIAGVILCGLGALLVILALKAGFSWLASLF